MEKLISFLATAASWLVTAGMTAGGDVPVVVWASSPVRPNETVVVASHSLVNTSGQQAQTAVELAAIGGEPGAPPAGMEPPFPANAAWQPQPLVRGDAEGVACVVPAAWPLGGWGCRVRPGEALPEPVLLNAPAPWWIRGGRPLDLRPPRVPQSLCRNGRA